MTNTFYGAATKLATAAPILGAIYFFDLSRWAQALVSARYLPFFILTLSLFGFGVLLKWKILRAKLELSSTNFILGILLLAGSVSLYVYGSYGPASGVPWFRYESFLVLSLSYVSFRIGSKILVALAPLLAILAFSFMPFSVFAFLDTLGGQAALVAVFALLFLVFANFRPKAVVLPIVMLALGLAASLLAGYSSPSLERLALVAVIMIPLPMALLAATKIRSIALLPSVDAVEVCGAQHHVLDDGFCSICGRRSGAARRRENFGLWGLLAIIIVGLFILYTSVPILTLSDGVPRDAFYTPQGSYGAITPGAPAGWVVNSTYAYNTTATTAVYSIQQVLVPVYHPETKNYTMYYQISGGVPNTHAPSDEIPGWTLAPSQITGLGPFQGDLITYTAPGKTMLVYTGRTTMSFMTRAGFGSYFVGVSFVREFKNTNVTQDTTDFMGDLTSLWLPGFSNDVYYSGWTAFAGEMYADGLEALSIFALVGSVALLSWTGYRVAQEDSHLDRFLTLAGTLAEDRWRYLSTLLRHSHYRATGYELVSKVRVDAEAQEEHDSDRADASLRALESMRLVKRVLMERGDDLVLTWKANA